jgi:rhodanese-related sulfurtransferase
MVKTILVSDLHKKKESYLILDVRTSSEYEAEHIEGSLNLPLNEVENYMDLLNKQTKKLAIICKSGNRSQMACKKLHTIDTLFSIEGGISAWKQHNYEIVTGNTVWDLERQVRFTAGILVFIGVLLHFLVHSTFIYVSGFVGVGLMFAAFTNTCAMGMVISKMPWNTSNKWKKEIEKLL